MKDIDSGFEDLIKDVNDIITIAPNLTDAEKIYIAQNYNENLKLYIKKFAEEETQTLRELVRERVLKGYRAESFKKDIQERYGVSERKADFLASQETKLITSSYNIAKAQDAGLKRYVWTTSKDIHVRHDHKILDGKIIDIDNPPVVDLKTGRRAHAGTDFGCRCYKRFIIE